MVGIKEHEQQGTINYFKIVQKAANDQNKVFFLEAGDGNTEFTEDLYIEDMWGWLIPKEKANQFNQLYLSSDKSILADDSPWWDYFLCAEWKKDNEDIKIDFIDYPDPFRDN